MTGGLIILLPLNMICTEETTLFIFFPVAFIVFYPFFSGGIACECVPVIFIFALKVSPSVSFNQGTGSGTVNFYAQRKKKAAHWQ